MTNVEQANPTQSVLRGGAQDDEDMLGLDLSHVSQAQKLGRLERATAKSLVSYSQSKKMADENHDLPLTEIRVLLSGSVESLEDKFSGSVEKFMCGIAGEVRKVEGPMEKFQYEMKGEVGMVGGAVQTFTTEVTEVKGGLEVGKRRKETGERGAGKQN